MLSHAHVKSISEYGSPRSDATPSDELYAYRWLMRVLNEAQLQRRFPSWRDDPGTEGRE